MSSQATQFATTFDRLGRRVLAQFESLPEGLWNRAPLSLILYGTLVIVVPAALLLNGAGM